MEYVVFLHGLGSHGITMRYIQSHFSENSSYKLLTISYQSLFFRRIEDIIDEVITKINRKIKEGDVLHLVGHSLGGLIARGVAASGLLRGKIHRIVTLGTPHYGAILANRILRVLPFIERISPIVRQLTKNSELIQSLPTPNTEIGVVAGISKHSITNPIISAAAVLLHKEHSHDGVVELHSAIHKQHSDSIILDVDHINMLWSSKVAKAALDFINCGLFMR